MRVYAAKPGGVSLFARTFQPWIYRRAYWSETFFVLLAPRFLAWSELATSALMKYELCLRLAVHERPAWTDSGLSLAGMVGWGLRSPGMFQSALHPST
jgi:hypothetical protein